MVAAVNLWGHWLILITCSLILAFGLAGLFFTLRAGG